MQHRSIVPAFPSERRHEHTPFPFKGIARGDCSIGGFQGSSSSSSRLRDHAPVTSVLTCSSRVTRSVRPGKRQEKKGTRMSPKNNRECVTAPFETQHALLPIRHSSAAGQTAFNQTSQNVRQTEHSRSTTTTSPAPANDPPPCETRGKETTPRAVYKQPAALLRYRLTVRTNTRTKRHSVPATARGAPAGQRAGAARRGSSQRPRARRAAKACWHLLEGSWLEGTRRQRLDRQA